MYERDAVFFGAHENDRLHIQCVFFGAHTVCALWCTYSVCSLVHIQCVFFGAHENDRLHIQCVRANLPPCCVLMLYCARKSATLLCVDAVLCAQICHSAVVDAVLCTQICHFAVCLCCIVRANLPLCRVFMLYCARKSATLPCVYAVLCAQICHSAVC